MSMWIQWVPLFALVLLTIGRVVVNVFDRPGTDRFTGPVGP